MSDKIRKNIHIEILKYAQKHREFRMRQLTEDLEFNQNEKNLFCQDLIHSKLLLDNTGRNESTDAGQESIFTISIEGRLRLLDHQQLFWAKALGIIAIVFSIGVAICTAWIQLTHPVTINSQQFGDIKTIKNELQSTNNKLEAIQANQSKSTEAIEQFEDAFASSNEK